MSKNGKALVRSPDFLDSMRNSGDPLADTTIDGILASGGLAEANAALGQLMRNLFGRFDSVPAYLSKYLDQCNTLPAWADKSKMHRTQEFFTSQAAIFGIALMTQSLPILYAGGKGGSQVLFHTGQLSGHFRRRASQTLRFIMDVMEPGSFEPMGKGIPAIQKVRLMHAAIRHYARNSPLWIGKTAGWGIPINQEELAGTLLAFSSMALEALQKLQVEVSDADQDCYLHTWKVIGHLLGIEEKMLPVDMADARQLWKQIDARNFIPTPEGQKLAVDHLTFLKELIPSRELNGFPNSLMHFLMGRRISGVILKLPRPGWTYYLLGMLTAILRLEGRIILSNTRFRKLTSLAGILLLESLYKIWNQGDGTPFRIPESMNDR